MYKLYLCLQYLGKRALAYFAMVAVALCVFMMLVAVSVMNGFVDKIERAAKGLFGDIVISAASLGGMAYYDEFIADMKRKVPAVEGASPFILTFGILQVPGTEYRRTVQVAGIRLPERATVSNFAEGLFVQKGMPNCSFAPPDDMVIRKLEQERERTAAILHREATFAPGKQPTSEQIALAERINTALSFQDTGLNNVLNAKTHQRELEALRKRAAEADKAGNAAEVKRLEADIRALERVEILPPAQRVILGLGIGGLSSRTPRGETIRVIGPGQQVALTLIPLGRGLSYTDITPTTRLFMVIDDCSTDVASIDSEIVYVRFDTLQKLNNMSAGYAADDPNRVVEPPRCSQIHVKIRPEYGEGYRIQDVARQIDGAWQEFKQAHPDALRTPMVVETWRQRQSRLVSSIEAQRTLIVIILGIVSSVAVVLIFVILYVIVMQKTRDIGVLKAVGASSAGVAEIFLAYGAAIALVGSVVGVVGGCAFVHNINPIHDWIGRTFGFVVWSRETFMFEKIPNEVGVFSAGMILVGAIVSGILGATIPAIKAARKQPVEALRYE
jgi:lipoprotein-releasing system permease protein